MKKNVLFGSFIAAVCFFLSAVPSFAAGTFDVTNYFSTSKIGYAHLEFNNFSPSILGNNCDFTNSGVYDATTDQRAAYISDCNLIDAGTSKADIVDPPYPLPEGSYYVVIQSFTGNHDSWRSTTFSVPATPPPPTSPISISHFVGATIKKNDTYTENGFFSDTDPASSWVATVDYADGSGAQSLSLVGNNFTLQHQYTTDGTYNVLVTVQDDLGNNASVTSVVNVAFGVVYMEVPNSPSGTQWNLSNFDPDPSTVGDTSCSGNGTDPQTGHGIASAIYRSTSTDLDNDSFGPNCHLFTSNGVHLGVGFAPLSLQQIPDGTYHGVFVGNNSQKIWISENFTLDHLHTAPSIGDIPNTTINPGDTYSYTASFSDPDSSSWSGVVNYGDGSQRESLAISGTDIPLSHQYIQSGVYMVTVSIVDDQGLIGMKRTQVTVSNPAPTTLNPIQDSYIKNGSDNENEGASVFMRLQQSGKNRGLIKFDQSQIQAAVGSSTNYTAILRLTISDNGNNWGSTGRPIEIHRMTQDWVEGNGYISGNSPSNRGTGSGATWNCAVDTNISNMSPNCSGSTAWNMNTQPPFISSSTDTKTITNNLSGTIDLNVTSDVQAFLNGTNNYGWLLKKTTEGSAGNIQFGTKESSTPPTLVITKS